MIHILQHHDCEGPAYLATLLQERGLEWQCVRADRGLLPGEMEQCSGLVILGGPQSVNRTDRFPWMRREIEFVRLAIDRGLPVLGICLGAQVVAAACGMQVVNCDYREIGWFPVQRSGAGAESAYFANVPEQFTCFHWHGEQILPHEDLPALAATEVTPCQALAPQPRVLALQFHLEVTEEAIRGMASAFSDELADEMIGLDSLLWDLPQQLAESQRLARAVIGPWLDVVAAGN
ncbi:type 1 glutamine amidotransferase [bacterium]|nr:type 1 glutamine amidotransferase [bacterium]